MKIATLCLHTLTDMALELLEYGFADSHLAAKTTKNRFEYYVRDGCYPYVMAWHLLLKAQMFGGGQKL